MNFYISYFTILSVISAIFVSLLALYLLTLQGRSKPSKHLGLTFMYLALFNGSYIISFSFIDDWAAYHRLGTVLFVLLAIAHLHLFAHHYGGVTFPRELKVIRILFYGITFVNFTYFFVEILKKNIYYDFNSNSFNFGTAET